jgi:uncharacterized membrane protein YhaH (DUF805 family)
LNWYIAAIKKYAVFSGRARRKEYWFFGLFSVLISFGLLIAQVLAGFAIKEAGWVVGTLASLYMLAMIVPSIAVTVRRLHDTGHIGWWYLLGILPLIGPIIVIVWLARDSDPLANKYGPNPKGPPGQAPAVLPI